MTAITRVPLCSVRVCPYPSDEGWHHCIICGANAVEHQHVEPRGMGGSKARDVPENIVMLCHACHEKITLHEWSDDIFETPVGRYYAVIGKSFEESIVRVLPSREEAVSVVQALAGDGMTPPTASSLDGSAPDGGVTPPSLDSEGDVRLIPLSHTPSESPPDVDPLLWQLWVSQGEVLRRRWAAFRWEVGDWVLRGDAEFGEYASQHFDSLGLSQEQVAQYSWVAKRFPPYARNPELSWSHHRELAAIESPQERADMLDRAVVEGMTTRELKAAVRAPVYVLGDEWRIEKKWIFRELLDAAEGFTNQATRNNGPKHIKAFLWALNEEAT